MSRENKQLLRDFRSRWASLTRADSLRNESDIAPLLSTLRAKFETSVNFLYGYNNLAAIKADLSRVKIRLSKKSLICLVRINEIRIDANTAEVFRLLTTSHYADSPPGYSTIVIAHGNVKELRLRCKIALQDSVILDSKQFEEVITSDSWCDALAKIIRSEKEPDILSPYDEVGVCSPELFLGREKEIARLTSHAKGHGYSIVGCRRLGKSSLLLRVKEYYDKIGEPTFYIDCQSCRTTETFYEEIVKRTNRRDFEHIERWALKGYLMRLATLHRKPVNLFLDEIDWVVAADEKYEYKFIISELLSACMTGKSAVRLWMVGYKDLYKAVITN